MRDLRMIYDRMKKLLDIRSPANYSRDKSWDLWGPFLVCILISRYAALNQHPDTRGDPDDRADIFLSVPHQRFRRSGDNCELPTAGVQLVAADSRRSLLQTLCIIGYCCAPMILPALVHVFAMRFYTFIISGVCAAWSIKCRPCSPRLHYSDTSMRRAREEGARRLPDLPLLHLPVLGHPASLTVDT